MSLTHVALFLVVGFVIGTLSVMVGIGGGILVIPVLMIAFGFTQLRANGTSLAMLMPPIGLLAVISYHRAGNIDWPVALTLSTGFAAGAALGGVVANRGWVHPTALRVILSVLLLYVVARTLFRTGGRARAAVETTVLVGGTTVAWFVARRLGDRWEKSLGRWGRTYAARRGPEPEHDYEI